MCAKSVVILLALLVGVLSSLYGCTVAAPPKATAPKRKELVKAQPYAQPQVITIDHFESLLRRAGEIFNPSRFQVIENPGSSSATPVQQLPIPYQQMQPPTEQPFNFYLPLFEYDNGKLDEKSRRLEKFAPPPVPGEQHDHTNYYAAKPKKLPKKFSGDSKQINLKWLNTFEKEALAGPNGDIPRAVYMVNDDRSRINFDDSFFADAYHVKAPADNEPHKEKLAGGNSAEDMGEEDLMAVPAVQVAQVNFNYDAPAQFRQRS